MSDSPITERHNQIVHSSFNAIHALVTTLADHLQTYKTDTDLLHIGNRMGDIASSVDSIHHDYQTYMDTHTDPQILMERRCKKCNSQLHLQSGYLFCTNQSCHFYNHAQQ